jgi:hypothetical protein
MRMTLSNLPEDEAIIVTCKQALWRVSVKITSYHVIRELTLIIVDGLHVFTPAHSAVVITSLHHVIFIAFAFHILCYQAITSHHSKSHKNHPPGYKPRNQ